MTLLLVLIRSTKSPEEPPDPIPFTTSEASTVAVKQIVCVHRESGVGPQIGSGFLETIDPWINLGLNVNPSSGLPAHPGPDISSSENRFSALVILSSKEPNRSSISGIS